MPILFNNCARRPHSKLYKEPKAFYDLNTTGNQAKLATDLKRGQECIVASYDDNRDVIFKSYSFSRESIRVDPIATSHFS
jgi:hypothetical protein